jgi:hypothetical protein
LVRSVAELRERGVANCCCGWAVLLEDGERKAIVGHDLGDESTTLYV